MLSILIVMLAILAAAAIVVFYVAFPHRDQDLPGATWLGDAMKRGVEAMPTLEEQTAERARLDELTRR